MKRTLQYLAIAGFTLITLNTCQSGLLDTNPYNALNSDKMWQKESLADKGVIGVYSALRQNNTGLKPYIFEPWGMTADNRSPQENLIMGKAASSDKLFAEFWQDHYEGIQRANDAIVHLPNVPGMKDVKKSRLLSECKFLRAYFYFRLNCLYKGVPLYLEPVNDWQQCTKPRSSEQEVWNAVVTDLTNCINDPNLPNNYAANNADYGRITKGAAYALRGKAYLWMAVDLKDAAYYAKAEKDFKMVKTCGFDLFHGDYAQLFKEANERSSEMIFSIQCIDMVGFGNDISWRYGTRSTFNSCWDNYFPNADFVDTFENSDGSTFNWNDIIPGYESLPVNDRIIYFLRDGLDKKKLDGLAKDYKISQAALKLYLVKGNEERIKKAYANRDPRLAATIITPYADYRGASGATEYTYTMRFPYIGYDEKKPFDLRTNETNHMYYLFRKFVAEGASEMSARDRSPIDVPIIRYADVLLNLAEAVNEQGRSAEAAGYVNLVRERVHMNDLSAGLSQADMRERIRMERRWEFLGEGVDFFDEMRWHTWKETKFYKGAGMKQVCGEIQYSNSWAGDYLYKWPIPRKEIQMNTSLIQNEGWND